MSTAIDNGQGYSNFSNKSFSGRGPHFKVLKKIDSVCPSTNYGSYLGCSKQFENKLKQISDRRNKVLSKLKQLSDRRNEVLSKLKLNESNPLYLSKNQYNFQCLHKNSHQNKVYGPIDPRIPQKLEIKKQVPYEMKKQQLLKKYPGQVVKNLQAGGMKEGIMIAEDVLMRFQQTTCNQTIKQSVQNHKKLVGTKCQNLNTVVDANQDYIHLKSYGKDYGETVLKNKTRQVDGLERVYHMRDGLKGLKQLRQSGIKYHNDIKPNNVAVKNDTFLLADFDMAANQVYQGQTNDKRWIPKNDVQNVWECVTRDINDRKLKMPRQNGHTDMINRFDKNYKQCTKNKDKLLQTKNIVQKLVEDQHYQINKELVFGSYQSKKSGTERLERTYRKIQEDVMLSDYRKQVKHQLAFTGATTAVNTIRSCVNKYASLKDNTKRGQIVKECAKVGLKQIAKGGLGIGAKVFEQKFTQNKIIKNFSNKDYRIPGLGKCSIYAGVEVAKQAIDFAFSDKKTNLKNLENSAKRVGINVAEFGVSQYLTQKISKKVGIEAAETFANYSAKTVASTVGKNTVTTIAKQAVEETGKKLFAKTFTSSLKGNAIGVGVNFAIGTVADVCRGKDLGTALKDNAKQAVGSTVGTALGAAVGSVVPVIGTAVGGFVGGLIGGFLSSW